MIPLVLLATAFAVRAAVGAAFPGPAYPDAYYYAHVAQQLASGDGLVAQYLWNLDDAGGRLAVPGVLPVYANALWMPLAEVIQVPSILLLGPTALAAGLPFWLVGAIAAPLTYWIGLDAGLSRLAAGAAGMLSAIPAGLTPFFAQPDNFGLFMVLGAASLWLCARGMRGDRWAFAAGGMLVGLATLTRADGALLGLPFALAWARELLTGRRVIGWAAALACAGLFMVATAPWLYRQVEAFGAALPASGRLLWLTDYQQLFSLDNPPTLDGWLAQGTGWIISTRVSGLLAAGGLFALLPLATVLTPFALIGAWVRRTDGAFGPAFVYAVGLFGAMGLLFAIVVPHGTFIHSASALLPHTYVLVMIGVATAVAWVARRRATWHPATATRLFIGAAVVVAFISAGVQSARTLREWANVRAIETALTQPMSQAPIDERFMAADPGAINYLTGRQGVITPADDLPSIEATMRAYDVRWLLLERRSIVPALEPVLAGTTRPSWMSRPIAVVPAERGAMASAGPVQQLVPEGALFAVCFDPADGRCAW
jgi:hypothetical protein